MSKVMLFYAVPPRILNGPTTREASVGEAVIFHCSVVGAPEPRLFW